MLFTERRGQIFLSKPPYSEAVEILSPPQTIVRDEGGLMSILPHPEYSENGWIYLSLSDPGPDGKANTKIVRGRIVDGAWRDQETVFQTPISAYSDVHRSFGSRLAFHDGFLFFTFGDRWDSQSAQNLLLANGKVHRIHPDGSLPADNPFAQRTDALPSIWSYGHRNPQGLAINRETGDVWTTEHGARGGDELNYIKAGENYGWPLVTHGVNYNGTPISASNQLPGLRDPVKQWTPSIANSPIHIYTGNAFPEWRGSLFLGSLATQLLLRFETEGDQILSEERLLSEYGRVRDIQTGPDGFLYLALELPGEPGFIVRLRPVDAMPAPAIATVSGSDS